jgi:hypothetical protein
VVVPSWILLAMGVLGALDIVLFHMWKQRLRSRSESRAELVTHFLRGPTYAALFLAVPNLRMEGAWFGALLAVLAFDVVISIADFWLETASRKSAGGLPRAEYVLHSLIAILFGALITTVLRDASALDAPTAATWIESGPPQALRILLAVLAPIALGSSLLDLAAVIRMNPAPR